MIVNPRNAEAKDLSLNNPLSQEVEVCCNVRWYISDPVWVLCTVNV